MDDLQKLRMELYQDAAARWPDQDPVENAERAYRFIINGSGDKVERDVVSVPMFPSYRDLRNYTLIASEIQPLAADTSAKPEPENSPDKQPTSISGKPISQKLIDTWLFIYRVQGDGPVKVASVIENFSIARTPTQRRLRKLCDRGYITQVGSGRATNYITAKTPPEITEIPASQPPVPQPREAKPEPVSESESDERHIGIAREAARWMQSIGYPVKTRNHGKFWECKGVDDLFTCREFINWANTKRVANGMPLFEIR